MKEGSHVKRRAQCLVISQASSDRELWTKENRGNNSAGGAFVRLIASSHIQTFAKMICFRN
jgi:hypothetical protein